jgi:threonine/homoserine/homoserine lactone efflux protein
MSLEAWLLFTATAIAASLTPGPAVLLVAGTGLGRGVAAASFAAAGVVAANAVYIALSVAGLGALLAASPALFTGIKWVGAAYLIWLGLRMILRRRDDRAVATVTPAREGPLRSFVRGAIGQLANPKAAIFYGAIFPQFLSPAGDVLMQSVVLAATEMVAEFLILVGYGALAAQGQRLARGGRYAAATERVSGALLVASGLGLATVRRA